MEIKLTANTVHHNPWRVGPLKPNLSIDEIHIWRIILPMQEEMQMHLQKHLSQDEQQRFNQFHFEKDRTNYRIARGGLRDIIARYINRSPSTIDFHYTEFGKPYLNNDLYFNLSHSANCILYAVSNCAHIGIDVEYNRMDIDFLSVAKQFCSEQEHIKLSKSAPKDLPIAFYRCWTRKEAFLKATGYGMHFPLKQVEVSFLPFEEVKLLNIMNKIPKNGLWQLEEVDPGQDYIASFATQQTYTTVSLWDWAL